MSQKQSHCPGGVGALLGKKSPSSAGAAPNRPQTQTLSSLSHLCKQYSVKDLNKVPSLLEEYPELFPRG